MRAEANSFALGFAALDFTAPELNRYAYRLEGYDRDWIAVDATHRLASYTNLPPGRYQLAIRGSNREGVWNERGLRIPVTVLPWWYQTWWFWRGAGAGAGAVRAYRLRTGSWRRSARRSSARWPAAPTTRCGSRRWPSSSAARPSASTARPASATPSWRRSTRWVSDPGFRRSRARTTWIAAAPASSCAACSMATSPTPRCSSATAACCISRTPTAPSSRRCATARA
ncbi:hypothetical protein HUX88_24995 [Duganella sp. BJB1802]|nr:hypothetical protein [Duganella sp. BJB1802]